MFWKLFFYVYAAGTAVGLWVIILLDGWNTQVLFTLLTAPVTGLGLWALAYGKKIFGRIAWQYWFIVLCVIGTSDVMSFLGSSAEARPGIVTWIFIVFEICGIYQYAFKSDALWGREDFIYEKQGPFTSRWE